MEQRKSLKAAVSLLLCVVFILILLGLLRSNFPFYFHTNGRDRGAETWCPIPDPASKPEDGLKTSQDFNSHDFLTKQISRLSAAVNISTESYDDNGDVETDPRWKKFDELHVELERLFPLAHQMLRLDHVNRYGLVLTWSGSESSLKPILFTAHQDVVPASSTRKWKYPPYEAAYDGQFLWGRGSSDCKNNLIGLLSTIESLLEQRWEPRRTIILAFGFDEETGGERGATYIAEHLEHIWGKKGIAMIVDEGGMGIETTGDVAYALPGVAEKGFMDVILTIETAGGHSSRPPKHTAIGIMAEMIQQLEAHPFSPVLSESNPFRGLLECQVRYTPQAIERWLEKALMKGGSGRDIGPRLVEERGDSVRYLMQTSQAVDIIDGGAKDNALPESVTALVNYRVAVHQSVSEVERSVTELLYPIAENHALNINDEVDTDESNPASGLFTLSVKDPLSPSPITPTSIEDPIWRLFSATIRQVFESTSHLEDKTVVPVGDIMTGNTDTIHYWDLSDHIYRFTPARTGTRFNAHTVDERVDMDAHIEGIRTYYELIRNFDVSDAV